MFDSIIEIIQFPFIKNALYACLLISWSCGITGSFITARRDSYTAGGISHALLGGIGLSRYLNVKYALAWLSPVKGACFAGIISSLILAWSSLKENSRRDSVISALWSTGMAAGILFMTITPGYTEDLMTYLVGNILMVSDNLIKNFLIFNIIITFIIIFFYRYFLLISFDKEYAQSKDINIFWIELIYFIISSLTIIMMVHVVGIILSIALITIPVASVAPFVSKMKSLMIMSGLLCLLESSAGIFISFKYDLPAGATIIIITGITFFILQCFTLLTKKN
jgi:zinc transport system permease protein